jgi:hypothetical protein
MEPDSVAEALDEGEDIASGTNSVLEGMEEALHRGVVESIGLSTVQISRTELGVAVVLDGAKARVGGPAPSAVALSRADRALRDREAASIPPAQRPGASVND